jgi:3-hydroxymyristoyl/3-hydroxydecanoyl-(acyl carrier protein) dehydratase
MSAEPTSPANSENRHPEIVEVARTDERVELKLIIPESLLYFRGHFPGFALLPGVVQLDWAIQYGREYFALGQIASEVASEVAATEIRIKFRKPIRPNHHVTLTLKHLPARSSIQFDYADDDGACSSGQIRFAPS